MMNEKLDWTQKMGDAFLAQQKDVMDTVQKLRLKAYGEGNLKSTEQQKVVVEEETKSIIVEPANPQVVYVPTYNPTAVYGAGRTRLPALLLLPPGYVLVRHYFPLVWVSLLALPGLRMGRLRMGRGEVDVDINRNTNINNNIDRSKHQNRYRTARVAGE